MVRSLSIEDRLSAFRDAKQVVSVGSLGTVLVITHKASTLTLPIDGDSLLTAGGGQVSGLSGRAINRILTDHGIVNEVGTESGRTSRGTPALARAYAELLNELKPSRNDFAAIERWWVARFAELFSTSPFKLNYDQSKTMVSALRNLLEQARDRQRRSPGKAYVGAVLQHLVGAKLDLALPQAKIIHHGFAVADAVSDRTGDFELDDLVIHCTTAPTEALLRKCAANLKSDKRPIILTIASMVSAAESYAESAGVVDRVEVMDAIQFVTANLYEKSLIKSEKRKTTLESLVRRYNEIVADHEADASLRIEVG